eukprot:TRINITY_DN12336_c0_g1_i1.p1 TRINITY_DN12336_c0_g1~~TRINITY_DN12336_c0_g1_i1.p1  ORF type:complete len:278 (+),score=45.67 TRINITY_DN12336_c0_g1_i1:82-915(+)
MYVRSPSPYNGEKPELSRDSLPAKRLEQLAILRRFANEKIGTVTDPAIKQIHENYADDACLCRYIVSVRENLDTAKLVLAETLDWLTENHLAAFVANDEYMSKIIGRDAIYRSGYDKGGFPFLVFHMSKIGNFSESMNYISYSLSMMILTMDTSRGLDRFSILLNFKDWSISSGPSINDLQEFITLMNTRFPERLHKFFMINTPWLFTPVWAIIKNFLKKEETKARYSFIKHFSDLHEHIETDQLPIEFGGNLEFNSDFYWQQEQCHWDELGYVYTV